MSKSQTLWFFIRLESNIKGSSISNWLMKKLVSLFILNKKNYVKYRGVLLDNKLSWKRHIDYTSNKISRTVGILSKLRHSLPKVILLKMYKSLWQPLLLYRINIWGQASKKVQENCYSCKSVLSDRYFSSIRLTVRYHYSLKLKYYQWLYFTSIQLLN